jgi:hypothetical protein
MVADRSPRFLVKETDYGCTYTCYRDADDENHYHRTMHFLFPFFTMSPVPKLGSTAMFVATIPVDDYHNMQWAMGVKVGEGRAMLLADGRDTSLPNTTDWLGRFRNYLSQEIETDFGIDREIQKNKPPNGVGFTGLKDVNTQDEAMKWGQGRMEGGIVRRDFEHLGTTDAMIIRVRRRLLEAAKALAEKGTTPPALETPEVYGVRSGWVNLPRNADWWEASYELREAFRIQQAKAAEATPAS